MASGDELIGHLLRRAGFGASDSDMAAFGNLSYAQAVDRLINYESIPDEVDSHIGQTGYASTTSTGAFSPNTVVNDARQRLLFRMLHSQRPLQEKMTLFWHNYFATGFSKISGVVQSLDGTRLMAAKASEDPMKQQGQIELLRASALGNFRDMLTAVAKDPAMLIWLDGNTNTAKQPQENFGRELMELFSRGVGFYTEDDVYAAARVFTGWNLKTTGATRGVNTSYSFVYNAGSHETSAKTFSFPIYSNGSSTIPARAASAGMQDGIDLINALSMHPETARRIAGKLWTFFISEVNAPDQDWINNTADYYLANGAFMKAVVNYVLLSPEFTDASNFFTRYSWPAEFVIKSLKETGWNGFSLNSALSPLVSMGQQLLEPPNVAGWVLGQSWFSTGAMLARMNFASTLAGNQKFNLATAAAGAKGSPQALVDFLMARMPLTDADGAVRNNLLNYVSSGTGATWTGSASQLQTKGAGAAHLILGSPEYQFV